MRIRYTLTKFYDWKPIEESVAKLMTPEDIKHALAAGIIKPGANSGYLKQIVVDQPTPGIICVPETDVIQKIVHEKAGVTRAKRVFSRAQAIAHHIQENVMPHLADASWITDIYVEDDDGPEADLFEQHVKPHMAAVSQRTGQNVIDPTHWDRHLAAYTQKATKQDLTDHLRAHLGVEVQKAVP